MNGSKVRPLQNTDRCLDLRRTEIQNRIILYLGEDLSTGATQKLGWINRFCSSLKEMLLKVKHCCVQWGK